MLTLCIVMSFTLIISAASPIDPAKIDLSVTATEESDGSYKVTYVATSTMLEELTKAAALYRTDPRMNEFRFICILSDSLVAQVESVEESDFSFDSVKWKDKDVFVFEKAKVSGDKLIITYILNPEVYQDWFTAPTADVKEALTKPMSMTATEVISAEALEKVGDTLKTTASIYIEGEGMLKYFDEYSVLAATGYNTMDVPSIEPGEDDGCPSDSRCPAGHFTDLNLQAWYHDGVHYCSEEDLMIGMTATTFEPDIMITRAMIATILYRLEGSPATVNAETFDDVDSLAWHAIPIEWAYANGVVEGYGNGKFGPDDPITREQMAAMLYRYANKKGLDVTVPADMAPILLFDIDDVSDYAVNAIEWACYTDLLQGYDDLTLRPQGQTRRCEAATLIYRYCTKILK